MAEQVTWNRTVNPSGGKGKNLEMDLQMEYFNKEFKGIHFVILQFLFLLYIIYYVYNQ